LQKGIKDKRKQRDSDIVTVSATSAKMNGHLVFKDPGLSCDHMKNTDSNRWKVLSQSNVGKGSTFVTATGCSLFII
jgi:hypothetical protein